MMDPTVIGVADIWGVGDNPATVYDVVIFATGLALTHAGERCMGPCAIHDPSDHHMRGMPALYRADRQIIERRCVHSVDHPDPDQVTYWQRVTMGPQEAAAQAVHGCCQDQCCKEES